MYIQHNGSVTGSYFTTDGHNYTKHAQPNEDMFVTRLVLAIVGFLSSVISRWLFTLTGKSS